MTAPYEGLLAQDAATRLEDLRAAAAARDAADELACFREQFIAHDDAAIPAYLDGNSLGRPLRVTEENLARFVRDTWGRRLIRGWDEGWMDLPTTVGDRIGEVALGAAPGQVVVGESTTVSLYKLVRAALDARPGRTEIVIDRGNFPSDRYVVEGIAAERGADLVWVEVEQGAGVTAADLEPVLGENTAVVLLSHVAFRSGYVADMAGITDLVHTHGALIVWDLCHSVGVLPLELDALGVDFAAGCTYKYLNGGPGSPAFLYVRRALIDHVAPPINGWMGAAEPFRMIQGHVPASGIRRFISGTPPIVGMQAMQDMLELIDEAGIDRVRAKSTALTEYAIELYDALLAPLGVELATPRNAHERGGHVTIDHPAFTRVVPQLWAQGILPDLRPPSGIRLGLSPLSTSFREVLTAVLAIAEALTTEEPA